MPETFRGRCECGYKSPGVQAQFLAFLPPDNGVVDAHKPEDLIPIADDECDYVLSQYAHTTRAAFFAGRLFDVGGGFCSVCGRPGAYYRIAGHDGYNELWPLLLGGVITGVAATVQQKGPFQIVFATVVGMVSAEFIVRVGTSMFLSLKYRRRLAALSSHGCRECGPTWITPAIELSKCLPCPSCSCQTQVIEASD